MRTRAERRKNDFKKAVRKRNLAETLSLIKYDNLHQYSKNKINCSCPMCSFKTNGKGEYHGWRNHTHADLVKIESMNEKEAEFGVDE